MNRKFILKKIILLASWWQSPYKMGRGLKACEPWNEKINTWMDDWRITALVEKLFSDVLKLSLVILKISRKYTIYFYIIKNTLIIIKRVRYTCIKRHAVLLENREWKIVNYFFLLKIKRRSYITWKRKYYNVWPPFAVRIVLLI